MNPFKIAGGLLIVLGFVFRAISLAVFNQRAKTLSPDPKVRRRFEDSKRRALVIDAGFILVGFYVLLHP